MRNFSKDDFKIMAVVGVAMICGMWFGYFARAIAESIAK